MMRRTASALMIVIMGCGIAAAADLELLPKGHPKKSPVERPVPARPRVPLTPMHPGPVLPAPAPVPPERQAPAQPPAAPALKQEAPTPRPSQQTPAQQPSAPQRLQSPDTPSDQGKPAPSAVPTPAPSSAPSSAPSGDKLNDLQPPVLPPPTGIESWWQKVVAKVPHCRTFSDGCRTCDATFKCSSMPIACQPKEFVCTDPASPKPSK